MLNIIVCVKVVTDPEAPTSAFKIDPEGKHVLPAQGVPPVLNPYDENSLEAALKIKESQPVKITIISAGKSIPKAVIKKSLAVGADDLIVIEDEQIKDKKLKFTREVPLKVTYHDPCHLGRHLGESGLYDIPRHILQNLPGITLLEMERRRENTWCCGAGAGVSQANPELALWTANERLKESKSTGVTALVTSCPWCERNFKDAVK